MTRSITEVRAMAGAGFEDMADEEVLGTMAAIERTMGRPLRATEASFLRGALAKRRTYLQQKAGIQQPAFVPEMYGDTRTAVERRADSNEQGEP